MQALIANASPLAGFVSEITPMRRDLDESRRCTRRLLVQAEGDDSLQGLATLSRARGARLAMRDRRRVMEERI